MVLGRKDILSKARFYYYIPGAFGKMIFSVLRQSQLTKQDLEVLVFLLLAPWRYILGFKGELRSPLGNVQVQSREKMKAVAYGTFKTHFSYLKNLTNLLQGRLSFPVLVDVGANIGDFSLTMAPYCGKVIAIEPGSENFAALESNITRNRLSNVVPLNVAASDSEGLIRLAGSGGMLHVTNQGESGQVKSVVLDRLFDGLRLEHIDLIKIDVQGHEEKVLSGMGKSLRSKRVGLLIVEAHIFHHVSPSTIISKMESQGYKLILKEDYLWNQPHLYFAANGGTDQVEADSIITASRERS